MPSRFFTRLYLILVIVCCLGGCGKFGKSPSARKKEIPKDNNYALGEVIGFGWDGNSEKYKLGGWGETEEEMTWTTAASAKLAFTIPETDQPLRLRMRLAGFVVPPTIPFQPVQVLVNDEEVAVWQVASDIVDYVAIIPPEMNDHEQLIVELHVLRAASPKILEVGTDSRTLGVSCFELSLAETTSAAAAAERQRRDDATPIGTEYKFGKVINFAAGGGSQPYKKSGWHIAEEYYTWIGRQPALLELKIPPSDCPLVLKMKLSGITDAWELPTQPTQILINGRPVAEWQVGPDWDIFETPIPSDIAAQGGDIEIELLAPKAVSPESLGVGSDQRILGVRCEGMKITEEKEIEQATPSTQFDHRKPSKDRARRPLSR